ncbi:MAG: hypothetical protein ACT4QC_15950 [Planctomycetaceae bacterium]
MNSLKEIARAVSELPDADLARFRTWFAEFDAEAWDQQLAADIAAGRLDKLADEALGDVRDGRCTDL